MSTFFQSTFSTNERGVPHVVMSLVYGTLQLAMNIGLLYLLQTDQTLYGYGYVLGMLVLLSGIYAYLKIKIFRVFANSSS